MSDTIEPGTIAPEYLGAVRCDICYGAGFLLLNTDPKYVAMGLPLQRNEERQRCHGQGAIAVDLRKLWIRQPWTPKEKP